MTARNKKKSFRVGKVAAYLRGEVWYLNYTEHGQRRRPRVGTDRNAARQLAAQINAQLETGESTVLSFEPISIAELQSRWLEHYDSVLRTSVNTISTLPCGDQPPDPFCQIKSGRPYDGAIPSRPRRGVREAHQDHQGLTQRSSQRTPPAPPGQGRPLHPFCMPDHVQLRHQAPTSAAVRRESVWGSRIRPDAD